MRVGDALPGVEKKVTQAQIQAYAEASGDFNPIHVDTDFASRSQYGGTIAHGMMVAAAISESMAQAFMMDWVESGRMKLRFKAPVLSGDTINTFGQVKSVSEREGKGEVVCTVGVRRQSGEVAITGEATVVRSTPA